LGKKKFIDLWELRREKDFKFVMGVMGKTRFLEFNLSLYPTLFLNDYNGKGMGA
jgi:hypothetical protein